MKAELKRSIPLQQFTVFAEIEVPETREDIQDYLKNSLEKNDPINKKIRQHLVQIGLLNNSNRLTTKGKYVAEAGKMAVSELGKFEIWSTEHDALAGSYILAFKRKGVHQNEFPTAKLNNMGGETYLSYLIEAKENRQEYITVINLGKKDPVFAKHSVSNKSVQLTWIFPEEQDSSLKLNGTISDKEFSQAIHQEIYNPYGDLSLNELLAENVSDWDSMNQRMHINLEGLGKDVIQRFIQPFYNFNCNSTRYGRFDGARVANIPVMPASTQVADEWLLRLLEYEAEKRFMLIEVFKQNASRFIELPALKPWNPARPKVTDILDDARSTTHKKPAFWNLAAPLDLNPFTSVKQRKKDIIHLIPNETYSFEEIARKIVPEEAVDTVVFADRYVQKPIQRNSFEAFLLGIRNLKNNPSAILFTLLDRGRIYEPDVEDTTVVDFSTIGHQDHDRFIIFIKNDGEWIVWKVSSSMTYLTFSGSFHETTEGVAKQSVTFVRGSSKLLTPTLHRQIQLKIQQNTAV